MKATPSVRWLCKSEGSAAFNLGSSSNGKTRVWQTCNEGSIPSDSTAQFGVMASDVGARVVRFPATELC